MAVDSVTQQAGYMGTNFEKGVPRLLAVPFNDSCNRTENGLQTTNVTLFPGMVNSTSQEDIFLLILLMSQNFKNNKNKLEVKE